MLDATQKEDWTACCKEAAGQARVRAPGIGGSAREGLLEGVWDS